MLRYLLVLASICTAQCGFADVQSTVIAIEALREQPGISVTVSQPIFGNTNAQIPTEDRQEMLQLQQQYADKYIELSNLNLTADVGSGRRSVVVKFDANIPIRAFRVVQVTKENQNAPMDGVNWRTFVYGAEIKLDLFGCGIGYRANMETVAVQVRGDPLENPRLASHPIVNDSVVIRHPTILPNEVLPKVSQVYRTPLVVPLAEPHYIADPSNYCSTPQCALWPGNPTVSRVKTMQVHIENFPGTAAGDLRLTNCVDFQHVHNQVMEPNHAMRADIDFRINPTCLNRSFVPEVNVSSCGRSGIDSPARFPVEIDSLTYFEERTDNLASLFAITTNTDDCKVESIDGDVSMTSTQGKCDFTIRRAGINKAWNRYRLHFKTEGSGNCRLIKPFNIIDLPPPPILYLVAPDLWSQRSGFHPDYDNFDHPSVMRRMDPENLTEPFYFERRQPVMLEHFCQGYSANGGYTRTWIDRVEVMRFETSAVLNVR